MLSSTYFTLVSGTDSYLTRRLFIHQNLSKIIPSRNDFRRKWRKDVKSRGNVVNPDEIIENYGADALRLYEMFMGPLEASLEWSTSGLDGALRFLNRVERMYDGETLEAKISDKNSGELDYEFHYLVKKVTNDYENLAFNTAISQMMIFVNEVYKAKSIYRPYLIEFTKLLAPICPHLGEELYERMGQKGGITFASWPTYDEKYLEKDVIKMAVQVNGKLRSVIEVDVNEAEEVIKEKALNDESVKRHTDNKTIIRIIVVKGKIVNIVVK